MGLKKKSLITGNLLDNSCWICSFSSCDRWQQIYLWKMGFSESSRGHRLRSRADRKAYIPQLFLHTNRAGIRTESCPKWGDTKGQDVREQNRVLGNKRSTKSTQVRCKAQEITALSLGFKKRNVREPEQKSKIGKTICRWQFHKFKELLSMLDQLTWSNAVIRN